MGAVVGPPARCPTQWPPSTSDKGEGSCSTSSGVLLKARRTKAPSSPHRLRKQVADESALDLGTSNLQGQTPSKGTYPGYGTTM